MQKRSINAALVRGVWQTRGDRGGHASPVTTIEPFLAIQALGYSPSPHPAGAISGSPSARLRCRPSLSQRPDPLVSGLQRVAKGERSSCSVADDALPTSDLALHARPKIVAAVALPNHPASRFDRLDVAVVLGGCGLGRRTDCRIDARQRAHTLPGQQDEAALAVEAQGRMIPTAKSVSVRAA